MSTPALVGVGWAGVPETIKSRKNKNNSLSCRVFTFATVLKYYSLSRLLTVNKMYLPVSHCLTWKGSWFKDSHYLQNTMRALMRLSVVSLIMYCWAAAMVSRCSQLNATGFTLSSLILASLYPDTQEQDPMEFYSVPASLAALIPEGDLVLTE